jgi:cell division protein FtsI (penicillin-binding protein 3)
MDKNFRIRLGLSFLCIALLGAGVLVRAAHLMLVSSDRLTTAMNRQFRQEPPRMPRRGYILDRNQDPIAVSMDVKSLFANPGKVKRSGEVAQLLAEALNMPAAQIRNRLNSDRTFVWIKRQLSETEQRKVEELLDNRPALSLFLGLSRETKRFYPHQGLAAQLLGFTGLDSKGLEGIELFYERELAGAGEPKRYADGRTLVLTIDNTLQNILEQEISQGLKDTGGVAVTAIIMNADSGDIVAMGSAPGFNPNRFGSSTAEHRRSRAVTDTYEPGSTMKPLLVAAALEEGVVTPRTTVFCEYGRLQIGRHWIRESDSKHRWGWLRVGQVLQKSSNVGATKIGEMMGAEMIHRWYKRLGITERTGIDLPGEAGGSIAQPERWSRILQSNISFGHGLAVTPLQVVRAYGAIANGGYLVKPRLVKQFRSFEGEFLKEVPQQPRQRVLQEATVRALTTMMSGVATDEGTAPRTAIPGFLIAGKTGTSQKPVPGKGYRSGKYMASFVGFVPGMKPNYVIYVMVDEPRFPHYGGLAAGPIFRRIMMAALAREGISPDPNLIPMAPLGRDGPNEERARDRVRNVAAAAMPPAELQAADEHWLMPDLAGLTARDVLDLFSDKELQLRLRGAGLVRSQRPLAGALLKRGSAVQVRLEREAVLP